MCGGLYAEGAYRRRNTVANCESGKTLLGAIHQGYDSKCY